MKTLKLFSLLIVASLGLSSCGGKKSGDNEVSSEKIDIKDYIEAAKAITPNMDDVSQYIKALELVNASMIV